MFKFLGVIHILNSRIPSQCLVVFFFSGIVSCSEYFHLAFKNIFHFNYKYDD